MKKNFLALQQIYQKEQIYLARVTFLLTKEEMKVALKHHICRLINRLAETLAAQYMPNQENAIDEGVVKFKGQLGFKQYMPMKPIKRGIKVWMHADSIIHFVS